MRPERFFYVISEVFPSELRRGAVPSIVARCRRRDVGCKRITLNLANIGEVLEMKMKSLAYSAVLGGAIAFAAMAGGTSQAEAAGFKSLSNLDSVVTHSNVEKVGGRRGRKFRKFRFRRFNNYYAGDLHGDRLHGCGFYKWQWRKTGFFHWKEKFFLCKGWW